MKVIKRSGIEEEFKAEKIINAVRSANNSLENEDDRLTENQILVIEEKVEKELSGYKHTANIETIQDLVIREIMKQQAYSLAQIYTEYRFKQNLVRKKNSTDDSILSLTTFEGSKIQNEEIKQENSNKNPMVASTQRDYIAGETSKDITRRLLLPNDIIEAHDKGIIHFHDMDYFVQRIFNCCLINLEDMLQNGTVISGTKIDRPNSFYTAANVTTQIIAQVASGQYGKEVAVVKVA